MTVQERIYPAGYFDLQLTFAKRVAEVLQRPYDDVLLEFTSLYKLLGIEGEFDATQPTWQATLLAAWSADAEQLHRLYLGQLGVIPRFTDERHWGCFAYDYRHEYDSHTNAIRIHFSNEDGSGLGALSRERMPVRLAELAAMFAHIAKHEPQATTVCGGSWLYNREAYCRLFPAAFTSSPVMDEPHYQYRALWGQFLRHDWTVNQELATRFLDRVAAMRTAEQIATCFPYQVLLTASPISTFFEYYGAGLDSSVSRDSRP